ncbi:MAG TPA: PfkB family carbohydrate kinase [Ignavibacteriaceae bacterium]|nr:PfkB family carbohydrate kinase [Ignavibacteriaceae bacterium]
MQRITSIGEILYDVYPTRKTPGGASFNFIYHIIKLTGEGHFVSRVGQDGEGADIINFLKTNNIPTDFIQVDNQHPTGESKATLNDMKIPSWKIKTGTAYDYVELNNEVESLIRDDTGCIYYGTLAQRNSITRNTVQHFFNRELKYFCDLNIRQNFYTRELIYDCITAANVLKLNIEELHLVSQLLLSRSYDTEETPGRLLDMFKIDQLCVTYGEKGAIIYEGDKKNNFRVKVENVVDTVGAGDAYASILCLGYLKGWNIEKTNETASKFAGEIVRINGALPEGSAIYDKYIELINE